MDKNTTPTGIVKYLIKQKGYDVYKNQQISAKELRLTAAELVNKYEAVQLLRKDTVITPGKALFIKQARGRPRKLAK